MNYLFLLFVIPAIFACRREPSIYHSKFDKSNGDNGVKIKINGNPESYSPGKVYTMHLMASNPLDPNQKFKKFIVNAEPTNDPNNFSPQKVGSFQLFRDSSAVFNYECVNTISETNDTLKSEVFFMWTAPPSGSGCIIFKGMILTDSNNWFADEDGLVKTICEQNEENGVADAEGCCSCDEATYNLVFEGLWSNITHPKDYPTLLWLTHFSDIIGASHERNFSFWCEGQIASEGFRSLAEWGSVRLMETELQAKRKFIRTIIKAAGLWYPNVNDNTTAKFKVDRKHNLVSLASMFGPTPDWVVGVNGLNLCLKDCSWIESIDVDLFPYDAGTDNGITYMSPNAETVPREKIRRITTSYPEDPRAPFYDQSRKEMLPLARLYLRRERVTSRGCDDNFLNAQIDLNEDTEDDTKVDCAVTDYSQWSNCSVQCGKGLRMRRREYKFPTQAAKANCKRQLVSKEMCVASIKECPREDNELISPGEASNSFDDEQMCATSEWDSWSECSVTCGIGFRMRSRHFLNKMGRKKCLHIITTEKEKCMRPACTGNAEKTENLNECPATEWSDWSPCSVTCGEGIRFRTRLLLVEPRLQEECASKIEMIEKAVCSVHTECQLDPETAKTVCNEDYEVGECVGQFRRWYFDKKRLLCLPFIYGGCRGNRNNFLTLEECNHSCMVLRENANHQSESNPQTSNYSTHRSDSNISSVSDQDEITSKVDCVVTKFSSWSPCSSTCGHGITQSRRFIKTKPRNGGKACPSRLVKKRQCIGPPCSTDSEEYLI